MENGSFIDDFPIKTSIYKGFSMAMLNNQMVYIHCMVFRFQSPNMFLDESVTGNIREPLEGGAPKLRLLVEENMN